METAVSSDFPRATQYSYSQAGEGLRNAVVGFLPSLSICFQAGDPGSRAGLAAEPLVAIPVPGPSSPVFNLDLLSLPLQPETMNPAAADKNCCMGQSQGMDSQIFCLQKTCRLALEEKLEHLSLGDEERHWCETWDVCGGAKRERLGVQKDKSQLVENFPLVQNHRQFRSRDVS